MTVDLCKCSQARSVAPGGPTGLHCLTCTRAVDTSVTPPVKRLTFDVEMVE